MKLPRFIYLLSFFLLSLPVLAAAQSQMESDILMHTNKFRSSKGLPPLQLDTFMSGLARDHSEHMAQRSIPFGHEGFEKRVAAISKQNGPVSASAENVANGQQSAEEVVDTWIKSPPHRKNMLGNYTRIGIGVSSGKGNKLYFTQVYTR